MKFKFRNLLIPLVAISLAACGNTPSEPVEPEGPKEPTINEIEKALKKLGLQYELEKDKSYPGKWYEKSGRVLVEWDKTKLELIRNISLKIKEFKK